jgi:hypothetical protein
MKQLLLYTTEGCHLCEQAAAMVEPLLQVEQLQVEQLQVEPLQAEQLQAEQLQAEQLHPERLARTAQVQLIMVEISESQELMARYGVRIPVLKFCDSQQELGWPFDEASVMRFFATALSF